VPDSDIKYEDVVSPLSELFTLCMWVQNYVRTAVIAGFMLDGPPGWEREIERLIEILPKFEQAIQPYLKELTIRNERLGGNIVFLTFEAPTAFELLAELAQGVKRKVQQVVGWNSNQIRITSSNSKRIKDILTEYQQECAALGQRAWAQAWSRLDACLKREQRIVMDITDAADANGGKARKENGDKALLGDTRSNKPKKTKPRGRTVEIIRALQDASTVDDITERFGVSAANVRQISHRLSNNEYEL
jgi:hypothetical protein